jgi:hypothetical protein
MKAYVIGAAVIWIVMGIAGAALLGQQHIEIGAIAGGPLTLFDGLDKKPADG